MASVAASPPLVSSPPRTPLPLPSTLTPSKISAFTSCPLAFRFSVLERLPEPPSLPAVRGTLVHRALQLLFTYTEAGGRDRARAQLSLERAFAELSSTDPDLAALELTEEARDLLFRQAGILLDRYFEIEDPDSVRPAGLEPMTAACAR